jgi:two-component system, OmpR family, sensor kinase
MRLRGVGVRLSLALLLVVALVLGIVYLVVVPQLRHSLIQAKLHQLESAAPSIARQLPSNKFRLGDYAVDAAQSANARVVIFDVIGPPLTLIAQGDSNNKSEDIDSDPLALQAAASDTRAVGTLERGGQRRAEVALPVRSGTTVVLLSASLHDSLGNVELVRRRILLAGAIALAAALLIGYGGASVFARRIRRLERAADRIAGGQFDEPVVDTHSDELGELATAFDRMRGRLSQLEHARREFIANASHELRTPLFSLGGSLELLVDEEMDEATRLQFLTTMRQQVHRLTKLATELLDLSRLDAGRLHVDLRPLHLGSVAEDVTEEFRVVADDHPLRLDVAGDPLGVGDEQRVIQIARILIENALRHTPGGTPVLVRAERGRDGAALVVQDAGPGIPAEHVAHVFERFYRIEGGLASGSGLGLAIGRELAELMGGHLEVESRPGRTVFTLWLAAPTAVEPEGQPRRREPVPT